MELADEATISVQVHGGSWRSPGEESMRLTCLGDRNEAGEEGVSEFRELPDS